ncbi:MAG: DUF3267 domain-containing protein [Oscillospiraceae bacterium]|nr:DUF3267 domain-containing protein [Oscillospiraceae bacterium]MBR4928649.1 DUF3267 domain-containing protein [Oscillospiraceae bacterium]
METVQVLPENYKEVCSIDLQKNKKEALIVNGIGGAVSLVMYIIMETRMPFMAWIYEKADKEQLLPALTALILGTVIYVILHEFTHGVTMKAAGGKQVKYGFTGMYAFAGSSKDYFPKRQYICIALAPVVLWRIILAVLQIFLHGWEWVVWFLQIMNIGGASGDIYVTARVAAMPKTILVMDTGVNMTVYDV